MPNDDYIKIDLPIHYAEKNVAQCWACKNCISQKEFRADMRKDIYIPSKETRVLLPECRVTEQYMTFVFELPCPHFEVIGRAKDAE